MDISNSGFVLLIHIAEQLTAKTYEDLVRTEVFDVANMNSSGVARNNQTEIFAKGYKDATRKNFTTVDFPFENVDGAGSVYSTTEDLYKLEQALRTGKLLTEKSKSLMLKQQIPEKYGYGWFIRERGGSWDVYWHKGDLPGVTTFIGRRAQKNQLIENDLAKILKTPE